VLHGLMQDDHQLTLQHLLQRARFVYSDSQVVTLTGRGSARAEFGEVVERVDRLSAALAALGVRPGDRVATLAWNTQQHLELYLSVPCTGAVLHTLNLRLAAEQLAYIINHAEDQVVFVEDNLIGLLEPVLGQLTTVRQWVVIGDGDPGMLYPVIRYDDLLASSSPPGYEYPVLDERQAAALCYTSGTTGNPKGVLYSHRSSLLHALGALGADSLGLSRSDRAMPVVPMFHANAWGIPYAAVLTGAGLVLPGRFTSAESLAHLIEVERVTLAGAVPTVWWDLLRYADAAGPDLSSLRMLVCGGAAVPLALMQAFEERHGTTVIQAWGLTETSPVVSLAVPPPDAGEDHWRFRDRAGRVLPLVEARLVDEAGGELPWDGAAVGEIELSGPWIAAAYYGHEEPDRKFHGRWFRTGDIGSIDQRGFVRITDRSKDVIKSGGEWISSLELESALAAHPAVAEAAVIARPDERWTERPLACVVLADGADVTGEQLRGHLAARVPKWWLPDQFAFVAEVPKTSTGKFDKKLLRERLRAGDLPTGNTARAHASGDGGSPR